MQSYDAIVLGTGGVGSAALFHLARRGQRVLGIDRFAAGHDRGSSHGDTRIIRQAYFEHPDYVPLLLRAYQLWAELEEQSGCQLFHQVGLLQIGPPQGAVIPGVLESATRHGLRVEQPTTREISRRFPGFHVPPDMAAVFEPGAGFLLVEQCVRTHLAMATSHGAEHRVGEAVQSFEPLGDSVIVRTDRAEYHAARLIVTAGPWSPQLLRALNVPLEVRRKDVFWFGPTPSSYLASSGCPTFLYELPEGVFYGFPVVSQDGLTHSGLRAAEHSGGRIVADPLTIDRAPDAANLERVASFLSEHLPQTAGANLQSSSVCFYTMSPDEHFLVGCLPQHANIVFAAGLSGHGFKFTGVLGEALADLAMAGRTTLPIGFLDWK